MRAAAPSGGWCWHACRGDEGWPAGGGRRPRPGAVLGPRRGALAGGRHLRVRPARAGRLRPLHRSHGLGRRARARPGGRLRVRPRVLRRDRGARARHRGHPAGRARGCCSVPIIVGPTGVEQIGYSNAYPGALAEHMVLQELLLPPGARRAGHRPGRADRTAGRRRARRGPGRPRRRASRASSSAAGRWGWP